ncbi:MAG TPA: hypothetical protein VK777_29120, partial [Reyranella sp.]|nr:hypothetical protein [Reyranella sp.]
LRAPVETTASFICDSSANEPEARGPEEHEMEWCELRANLLETIRDVLQKSNRIGLQRQLRKMPTSPGMPPG